MLCSQSIPQALVAPPHEVRLTYGAPSFGPIRNRLLLEASEAHSVYTAAYLRCSRIQQRLADLPDSSPGRRLILLWDLADAETALDQADRRHEQAASAYKASRFEGSRP